MIEPKVLEEGVLISALRNLGFNPMEKFQT
jgi:hypothetical protein